MNKRLSLFLAITLILSLFSGCALLRSPEALMSDYREDIANLDSYGYSAAITGTINGTNLQALIGEDADLSLTGVAKGSLIVSGYTDKSSDYTKATIGVNATYDSVSYNKEALTTIIASEDVLYIDAKAVFDTLSEYVDDEYPYDEQYIELNLAELEEESGVERESLKDSETVSDIKSYFKTMLTEDGVYEKDGKSANVSLSQVPLSEIYINLTDILLNHKDEILGSLSDAANNFLSDDTDSFTDPTQVDFDTFEDAIESEEAQEALDQVKETLDEYGLSVNVGYTVSKEKKVYSESATLMLTATDEAGSAMEILTITYAIDYDTSVEDAAIVPTADNVIPASKLIEDSEYTPSDLSVFDIEYDNSDFEYEDSEESESDDSWFTSADDPSNIMDDWDNADWVITSENPDGSFEGDTNSDQSDDGEGESGFDWSFIEEESEPLNEYGFYFNVPYEAVVTDSNGNERRIAYYFYETSCDIYVDGSWVDSRNGDMGYDYLTIFGTLIVSSDGKQITDPDSGDVLYYDPNGEDYTFADSSWVTNNNSSEDGTSQNNTDSSDPNTENNTVSSSDGDLSSVDVAAKLFATTYENDHKFIGLKSDTDSGSVSTYISDSDTEESTYFSSSAYVSGTDVWISIDQQYHRVPDGLSSVFDSNDEIYEFFIGWEVSFLEDSYDSVKVSEYKQAGNYKYKSFTYLDDGTECEGIIGLRFIDSESIGVTLLVVENGPSTVVDAFMDLLEDY